ncbi:MAG: hypothetical protein ACFFER_07405 [Candidatus Thorarchaeota archaeon]
MSDDYDEEQKRRERARMYLISVAELNQLIVREFRSSTDGFSEDDVANRFPKHSLQQIRDALESAVEDEYFRVTTRENGSLWYAPMIYSEE